MCPVHRGKGTLCVLPACHIALSGTLCENIDLKPTCKAVYPASINPNHFSGWEQEALAIKAGFESAKHNEIAFGLMGVLVATKAKAGSMRS